MKCKECNESTNGFQVNLDTLVFCLDCFYKNIPKPTAKTNPKYTVLTGIRVNKIEARKNELLEKHSNK